MRESQKFALPVSICVTLRNVFASCTQVPCDAGVTMETPLLNGKIRLQNSFILITFNFSICSKYFSLFNIEWTRNITNLWAEGWYAPLAQLFRHCHHVLLIDSFCSYYYLYKKRQVMDKAYMYFIYLSSEDIVRQTLPNGDFKHSVSNGDPIKGPSPVPHCVLWNKRESLVWEGTQDTTEPVDTCQLTTATILTH